MKKKLILPLILTCALSLAACSSQEKSKEITTVTTQEVTTEATTEPATEATTEPTTEATTEPTTEATTEPTTEATTEPEVDPVIIVLDPGHDSEIHRRDHKNLSMNEQDLNLTIALACRDRLLEYEGVEVYMTREDGSCPDAANHGDTELETRTGLGAKVGADLFVALHCNGTTGELGPKRPQGAEVFVPNYKKYTADMKVLGELIINNLAKTGVKAKGVYVRTKEEKGHYDDGSVQDWYYLISLSVEGGNPGIIIEHAYMDNTHDNKILKDEKNLIQMGILDADAMAEYYGLKLKNAPAEETPTEKTTTEETSAEKTSAEKTPMEVTTAE